MIDATHLKTQRTATSLGVKTQSVMSPASRLMSSKPGIRYGVFGICSGLGFFGGLAEGSGLSALAVHAS